VRAEEVLAGYVVEKERRDGIAEGWKKTARRMQGASAKRVMDSGTFFGYAGHAGHGRRSCGVEEWRGKRGSRQSTS